jgi:iron complex outermembrane receptor protein
MARGSYNTHSDYRVSGGDRVTNTRATMKRFKTGIGYSNSSFLPFFDTITINWI